VNIYDLLITRMQRRVTMLVIVCDVSHAWC